MIDMHKELEVLKGITFSDFAGETLEFINAFEEEIWRLEKITSTIIKYKNMERGFK